MIVWWHYLYNDLVPCTMIGCCARPSAVKLLSIDSCESVLPPGFETQVSHLQDRHASHYNTAACASLQQQHETVYEFLF